MTRGSRRVTMKPTRTERDAANKVQQGVAIEPRPRGRGQLLMHKNFEWQNLQALPLVSTFWGILLFGEYRKSSRRAYILLASMLFMFIVAVAVLMASAGSRE
ncbi:hypothetical protein HYC85_015667 [Camellia sinensis]|uniref:Uncharacterized protein n=1 Tax=Camellia sinensis TaxID=4442 RepID=A0A7J7GXI8_CAMSI|nr:hypothetical protein HYC85_015667 [Camellia sinensis]